MSDGNGAVDMEAVFSGAVRPVTLGSRTYEIKEPVRAVARDWRRFFVDLETRGQEAMKGGEKGLLLDVQDEVLDAVFKIPELAADKAYIEAHATERQLLEAIKAFRELLDDPFMSMQPAAAKTAPRAVRRGRKKKARR